MKYTRLFIYALFLTFSISCNDDDETEKRFTNFDVPELTDDNTIQFTVSIDENSYYSYAHVVLDGGKIAVDWGDGTVTKDMNPGKGKELRTEFTHVYKIAGEYQVRIWSKEVELINLGSATQSHSKLKIGDSPSLGHAVFYNFQEEKTLNLNSCPKLSYLHVGNWALLESMTLDHCAELKHIESSSNPSLKKIDVTKNTSLTYLTCTGSGVEDLKLPPSIVYLYCYNNSLTNLDLSNLENLNTLVCAQNKKLESLNVTGCKKLVSLDFSDTMIESFDFSEFLELGQAIFSNTRMTNIDISKNKKLGALKCGGLSLTSLDITNNANLIVLDCSSNQLKSLDVSKNSSLKYLLVNDNQLEKDELETIFKALPIFSLTRMEDSPPPIQYPVITIFGNPGATSCNTKLITDKRWVIN